MFVDGVAWPVALSAAGASLPQLNLTGRAARRCLADRAMLV
jgi:hypothetical protein